MNQLAVRVARKTREAEDILSIELVSADGARLPAFSAGSHIDVQIRPGLIRQYSLCNDPTEQHRYLIAVLRDPTSRGGSVAIHDGVREGDVLQISPPKNYFPLVHARRSLLLAGGIGVTPILCMAERLAHIGANFEMHYCTRSEERTAFRDRIRTSGFADRVQFHFDDGPGSGRMNLPGILSPPAPDCHLYVCGPSGFIDYVMNTARAQGWQPDQLHLEYFAGVVQDTSGDPSFDVKLASSGQVFTIPADKSVVQVLAENGIDIPISCEQGVCGTCITRVLDGVPDHRDMYFTDDEKSKNDQFTPCCSRAKSAMLVLDL